MTKKSKKIKEKGKQIKGMKIGGKKYKRAGDVLCSEASSQIPVNVVVLLMLMFNWGEEWHYDQDNSDLYFNKH